MNNELNKHNNLEAINIEGHVNKATLLEDNKNIEFKAREEALRSKACIIIPGYGEKMLTFDQ